MMFRKTIRIPLDRVGAVVGRSGKTKIWIEEKCKVTLKIDSSSGEILISSDNLSSNPLLSVDLVQAISHGFSQSNASNLFAENNYLNIIDLKPYCGKSSNSLSRIKSRLIGQNGKTRRVMEEITNTHISVYGHSISVIGSYEQIKLIEDAINVIISGGQHKTAYNLLQRNRTRSKLDRLKLWEDSSIVKN